MEPDAILNVDMPGGDESFAQDEAYVPDAPGQQAYDNSPLTAEEILEYGLDPADFPNVKLADSPDAEAPGASLESAGVTDDSPGSGAPSAPPAPQLDANQQFMATMFAQMQAQAQAQQQAFQAALAQLAPKPTEPAPVDPFADMPKELRAEIEQNPALKAYTEYMAKKAQTPAEQFKQEFEERIQKAQQEREAVRYAQEAEAAAKAVLSQGFALEGQDAAIVADGLRDMALTLSHVHGGAPAQYQKALDRIINTAVNGRIKHLNSQAAAKVAQRAPAPNRPQVAPQAIPPAAANREPTLEEIRAAGYRSAFEAGLDGDKRIIELRARRGRG